MGNESQNSTSSSTCTTCNMSHNLFINDSRYQNFLTMIFNLLGIHNHIICDPGAKFWVTDILVTKVDGWMVSGRCELSHENKPNALVTST